MAWQDDLVALLAKVDQQAERTRTELATGLAQTHNAIRLQGARNVPLGAGGRALLCAGPGRLVGWSVRATAGPASVNLRDSRDTSGDPLAVIDLAVGESTTIWLGPGGVSFTEGLYAEVAAGTVTGSAWLGAVD